MTIELLYTSAAQGLKQGSRGFCTVVCTAGLPINLAQRLEALSGYRHLYQPGDQRADDNPVCYSHIRLAVGGKTLSILSRVGAYGVDYSQRTNKIAHHVVFDGPVPECGPAAVLAQSGIMRTNWDGECKTLQSGPEVSSITVQPAPCKEWQRIAGDAGWAGVVANAWLQPTGKPVWIVFSESQSVSLLELMQEATAILPESRRWQATFSTYCTNLPPDVECRVRCVIAGSDEARMSIARGTVLDLTKPMGVAPVNDATGAARIGRTVDPIRKPALPNETLSSDFVHEKESVATTEYDETEYRLKHELPGYSPPAMKLGKFKRIENESVFSPKSKRQIKKLVASIVAGSMIVLATVGIATFFYFNSSKPLAVVETLATNTNETTGEPAPNTGQVPATREVESKERQAPVSDPRDAEKKELQVPAMPLTRKITLLKDSHSVTSFEFRESAGTVDELFLADIHIAELHNLDWTKITFHSDEQTLPSKFVARDGKLFLKSKELVQLRSKKCSISIDYKEGDIQLEPFNFSFTFTNVNDPNIELLIRDSKSSETNSNFQVSDFAAKTILGAVATIEDRDEVPGSRRWSWYRRISGSNGPWQLIDLAKEQTYEVHLESDTGHELQSWLEYSTNNPESESTAWTTVVKSQAVQVLKPSTGTILIPQPGVESEGDLNVSVAFLTPQFSKLSVESKPGKTKIVHSYKPVGGVKLGFKIESNAETNLQLKSLVPKEEIEKLTQKTQSLQTATRDFASAIDNFRSQIRKAKSISKNNKHLLTIEKLLFREVKSDPMGRLLGFLQNREKAVQLIDDTLSLYRLLNIDKDKLTKTESAKLAELKGKFIEKDNGYPQFNNDSLLKNISPEQRTFSLNEFKSFWDAQNGFLLINSWSQINEAAFVSQLDQLSQYKIGENANGIITSTVEAGDNSKSFLEFPFRLDIRIELRSDLVGFVPSGTTPSGNIKNVQNTNIAP